MRHSLTPVYGPIAVVAAAVDCKIPVAILVDSVAMFRPAQLRQIFFISWPLVKHMN